MSATMQTPVPGTGRGRSSVTVELRRLVRDTVRGLRGHDLPLHAAGATFYAGIALVPSLLVAIWVVGLVIGGPELAMYADRLASALPDGLGAPPVARGLVDAAASLTAVTALVALVPATFYGEGLRRAFASIEESRETLTGWRGRLRVLPLLAAAPVLAMLVLAITPLLAELFAAGDAGSALLGVYLSFLVDWVTLSPALAYVYRFVAPSPVSTRAALWGGFTTGSILAGFVQGFVLFLSFPLDVGRPFGGYRPVGAMIAIALWLWVLHLIVLVGYEFTRHVDVRGGVPWRSATRLVD